MLRVKSVRGSRGRTLPVVRNDCRKKRPMRSSTQTQWRVLATATFIPCGGPIARSVAQMTKFALESQQQVTKWYLCHQCGNWGMSGKDRTNLLFCPHYKIQLTATKLAVNLCSHHAQKNRTPESLSVFHSVCDAFCRSLKRSLISVSANH